jgi:rod shape-determining protein MreC
MFFLFFFLALGIFFLSKTAFGQGLTGVFEQLVLPLQRSTFTNSHTEKLTPERELQAENTKLKTQLAELNQLKKENNALRDQFKSETQNSRKLLPAQIIGNKDDDIVIDKGSSDGVNAGSVLIVNNNLVGRVTTVTAHRAVGELLTNTDTSFTVKTSKTSALGIGRGEGGGSVVIDNVVLSDKLEKDDIVITKGDIDANGKGYPPGLVVGKIVSVNKKASALFQAAEVAPLVDFNRMDTVFVMAEGK